ncbi:DUF4429 domain-containing protein [Streptomyces lunaelactis]|uniref:DUF4429 domain-containing protein n=1 Tax=Streptomyces lunaelactis TaxID=1535768 RepID=UPI001584F32E|nr:DUF4429 domain-containing protein [Streptomyces lunaelactis]NUK09224.1 DUF4429 domain-containing protein [Streptomyces lunaelactis]NUK23666.1 DUF4429 domain-containing protein [Streptomyces lunaelactis]NUK32348.1 DUF4429 domain-containing protein [Streptomyces lunaelactis]NUK40378.1 DUF4429 domain-containing protein [Streptomyces lunaelactis]NUK51040.1 DUF4429 domain-containing protein [Streptomyces lunaelactis]
MGDVLAGIQATWEFETDSVLIRFERGIRTPKLFSALRERRIPHEALTSVTLSPGKRGTVVLHAAPRPGADPLMEAAAGQLKEGCDPYRLVLPAERETLAEYYADELRALLGPDADKPAERYAVAAPEAPLNFKAYDGKASFDGSHVSFRWFWTGASSAKWKAGDQSFPVTELSGVEWRSPEVFDGYLRLLGRGAGPGPDSGDAVPQPAQADQDPAAVVFGLGYGPVHESLPFAAAVLESVRNADTAPAPAVRPGRRDPADIAERIRHLGELHGAGLVTDEEFSTKKSQLLAEL